MSVENRPDMSKRATFADVVIVGGGLSGIAIAYKLAKLGVDFQLLEARARFGGRILALDSARSSARFDLGPSWFWPTQEHIKSLIKELGLDGLMYAQYSNGDAVFEPQGAFVRPQRAWVNFCLACTVQNSRLGGQKPTDSVCTAITALKLKLGRLASPTHTAK